MSTDDRLPDMALALTEHLRPWTEDEYFALGETVDRVELFDGSLVVTPAPNVRHQVVSRRLADVLDPPAREAGLTVYLTINLRPRNGRIFVPDLVVSRPVDLDTLVVDAPSIALVCEVTSTNAGTDRLLKMNCYAEAGIPRYLIVEPKGPVLELYKLDGDRYVPEASAGPGGRLLITDPVVVEIDPGSLVG
jgi:Uma2 family endonuclease